MIEPAAAAAAAAAALGRQGQAAPETVRADQSRPGRRSVSWLAVLGWAESGNMPAAVRLGDGGVTYGVVVMPSALTGTCGGETGSETKMGPERRMTLRKANPLRPVIKRHPSYFRISYNCSKPIYDTLSLAKLLRCCFISLIVCIVTRQPLERWVTPLASLLILRYTTVA